MGGKKKNKQQKNLPVGMAAPGPTQPAAPRPAQQAAPRPVQQAAPRPPQQAAPKPPQQAAPRQASPVSEEPQGAWGGDLESGMETLSLRESSPTEDKKTWRKVSPDRLGYSRDVTKLISKMPKKPGINKMGQPIRLVTNLYPLKYGSGYVYHYDIEIFTVGRQSTTTRATKIDKSEKKFRCLSTKLNREVFEQVRQTSTLFRGVGAVYDGMKNAITTEKLKMTEPVFQHKLEWDERQFVVQIQPVEKDGGGCEISLDLIKEAMKGRGPIPRESIAALEIILKHSACLRHIPIMQSFFSPPERPVFLTPLSEVWFGYHQSVRLASTGPVVNLNTSASVFYKAGPLVNFLMGVFEVDAVGLKRLVWNNRNYDELIKRLKDLKVKTTHLPNYQRKRKISGFTRESADQKRFEMDGAQVRVVDYFRDRYRVNLQYPNLPCIIADNPLKNIFIPVELCQVVEGQRCKDRELWRPEEMIKVTAEPPVKKFQQIYEIREQKTLFDQDPNLRSFGLQVSHSPLEVDGRKLNPPSVLYHGESKDPIARPANGAWNLRDKRFLIGTTINSWVMLSFTRVQKNHLETFARALVKFANIQGMYMGACQAIQTQTPPRGRENQPAIESFLERGFATLKSKQLAVLVIPDKDNSLIYTLSKQAADKVGVTLQCVQEHNVIPPRGFPGPSPSLICNILLKINAKMGGVNSSLRQGELPKLMCDIMFMGADVTHPSPVGDIPCSIAAVVASMDKDFAIYELEVKAQRSDYGKESREVIRDFQTICLNLLTRYQEVNKKLPKGVVVYRDGVSDGEVPIVQEKEVEALQKALRSLGKDAIPIAYIVVQKRHNVRMMPKNPRDGDRRTGNPPAGTMADTVITHPFLYDFYMYPHNGLQGTSKPIYCMVVRDNFGISPDDLHNMTFILCHLYAPCTKSISMPAPVRYADKAAFIARARLESQFRSIREPRGVDFTEMNLRLSAIQFKHVV